MAVKLNSVVRLLNSEAKLTTKTAEEIDRQIKASSWKEKLYVHVSVMYVLKRGLPLEFRIYEAGTFGTVLELGGNYSPHTYA